MITVKCPSDIVDTGDWALDNSSGRDLAQRLINDGRANCCTIELFAVLREVAKSDRFGGAEVGFLQTIATACVR